MMTFADFQSTRQHCNDLGAVVGDYFNGIRSGYVYNRDCFIESDGDEYVLTLYFDVIRSRNLECLEKALYEWACNESLFD